VSGRPERQPTERERAEHRERAAAIRREEEQENARLLAREGARPDAEAEFRAEFERQWRKVWMDLDRATKPRGNAGRSRPRWKERG
jgi:hypothetical protein